jgi:hypothetical protein
MYGIAGKKFPQSLLTLLDDKPLLCPISQEEGYAYTSNMYFYDMIPASKDLDFDSALEQNEPFMK